MFLRGFLLSVFLFSINISSSAQRFDFGFTGGVLSSQFDGDRLFGFSKLGPIAGLNWYYNINESSQLQFDIDYLNIGSNYKDEKRPVSFQTEKFTLLSINAHAASLFIGLNKKINKYDDEFFRYKITPGLRISRAFIFNTFNHNTGVQQYVFDENNLTSTFIAPEIRLGAYLTKNLSFQLVFSIGINNMMLMEENNVDLLRPFYMGLTSSYIIETKSKKKRKKR